MGQAVDLLQFLDRDLRIDFGRRELSVTEHRLDVTDVRAILQHQSCHRVTEQMTGATLADVGFIDVVTDVLGQRVRF